MERIAQTKSDGAESDVRLRGKLDANRVARMDFAFMQDGAHDACASCFFAGRIEWTPEMLLEAGSIVVDLPARCAQPGYLDNGLGPEVEERSKRQRQKVEAAREHVFSELAGRDGEAPGSELIQHLLGKKMHLAEVGLPRIATHSVEVLRGRATMRIAIDTFAGNETDRRLRDF